MKPYTKDEFLELVYEYDVIGTDAFDDSFTDKQREAVACAACDLRRNERMFGNPDSDEFCEHATYAAAAWLNDFNAGYNSL